MPDATWVGPSTEPAEQGFVQWTRNLAAVPLIYSLTAPIALLDLWVTIYQSICFPLFGISRVQRGDYVVLDRHRLPYLGLVEKLHCAYCGYATGVLSYAREIAARTEQYWCPIKHAGNVSDPHEHYQLFFEYGDATYHSRLAELRAELRTPHRHQPRR